MCLFLRMHPGEYFISLRRAEERGDGPADRQLAVDGLRLVGCRLGDRAVRRNAPPNAEGALEGAAERVPSCAVRHFQGSVGAPLRTYPRRNQSQRPNSAVHAGPESQPSAFADLLAGCP